MGHHPAASLRAAIAAALLAASAAPAEPAAPVRKLVEARTGACTLVDANGRCVTYADLDRLADERFDTMRRRYGNLSGALQQVFDHMAATDTVSVQILPVQPAVRHINRFTHPLSELQAHSRSVLRLEQPSRTHVVRRSGLMGLMRDPAVAAVSLARPAAVCGYHVEPWSTLAEAAYNPTPHPADSGGAHVRAGHVEGILTPQYDACQQGLGGTSDTMSHADQTWACLRNAAPLATARHKVANSYTTFGAEQWLADSGIETVSFSREAVGDRNDAEFLLMDDYAYRFPFPVFCNPAGNGGWGHQEVYWQGYNGISVGSVKHRQKNSYLLDDFTSDRNPDPVYGSCVAGGSTPCAGDREMPEILAPGSHPWASSRDTCVNCVWSDSCSRTYFWTEGTSFSAPTLSGVAARLISSAPRLLRGRPEAVKMALLLTAQNVDGGYWNVADDGRDGAGAVSAYSAVEYLSRCTDLTGQPPAAAAEHGFCSDTGDSGMVERAFAVMVPAAPPESTHLRVTLTWTGSPVRNAGRNYLSDLDIGGLVSDSGRSYGSYSLDDNVEMFDVPAGELTPGDTYAFSLYPRSIRIPPTASATFFYYTLGWTWVRDHAAEPDLAALPSAGRGAPAGRLCARVTAAGAGRLVLRIESAEAADDGRVRLTDLSGRLVYRSGLLRLRAATTTHTVALPAGLANGIYLLTVSAGERSVSARFHYAR